MAGIESNGTGQDKEEAADDGAIAEIEERRDEAVNIETVDIVEDGVSKHIESRGGRCQIRAPPPTPILGN